jgi:DNA-binding MarR family transcriptional regulator
MLRYPISRVTIPPQKRRRPLQLDTHEYEQLAAFRHALRGFLRFSEAEAEKRGLTAQNYQALLVLRACPEGQRVTINDLAEQLMVRHNSAVGLVDRLSRQRLVAREPAPEDRRKVYLRLTAKGARVLERLAEVHREELHRIGPQLEELLQQIIRATEERIKT